MKWVKKLKARISIFSLASSRGKFSEDERIRGRNRSITPGPEHWANYQKLFTDTVHTLKMFPMQYVYQRASREFVLSYTLGDIDSVKPWVIQSFLTSESKDRTFKCDHSLESC